LVTFDYFNKSGYFGPHIMHYAAAADTSLLLSIKHSLTGVTGFLSFVYFP